VTTSLANVIAFLRVQAGDSSFKPQFMIPSQELFSIFAEPGQGIKSFWIG
jgi:hypothetical protein